MGKIKNTNEVIRFYKELLVRENRGTITILLLLSVCEVVVALIPPMLMIRVLDHAVPDHEVGQVFMLGAGVLIFTICESVINYILNWIYCRFGNHIYVNYQQKCLKHLLEMTGEYYSSMSNGEVFTTVFQDIAKIKGFVSKTVFQFVSDIVIAVCMFGFLLYLQWDLLLIISLILPFVYLSQTYFQRLGNKLASSFRESFGNITGLLESMISGIMPLLFSRGEYFFYKKYKEYVSDYTQREMEIELAFAKNDGVLKFLSALISIVVLAYGGIKVISGSLTIGGFMAFHMYSSRLAVPIFEASGVLMDFQSRKVSLYKVYQFLDLPGIMKENKKREGIQKYGTQIELKDIIFSYKDDSVLCHAATGFWPDALHVVVGESGAGKSTILSLLYRFWDLQSGNIKINSTEINAYDVNYIRNQICVVSQDMFLFHDTIRNNIALGLQQDQSEIEQAAREACIHDFIVSLPDGYDTVIGEKGINLSGGERQRICLARAFAKDASVWILDEATSALDQITEKKVLENLKCRVKGKTMILITHRLQSVTDADCIHVLRNGRFIAEGTHEELLVSNEYYKKLYLRDTGGSY